MKRLSQGPVQRRLLMQVVFAVMYRVAVKLHIVRIQRVFTEKALREVSQEVWQVIPSARLA